MVGLGREQSWARVSRESLEDFFLHFGFAFLLLYYGVDEQGARILDAGQPRAAIIPRGFRHASAGSFYHEAGPCQWACHNLM